MSRALIHGLLTLIGVLVMLQGLGLAVVPRGLAFILGPAAALPENRGWTRLQGTGFILLGGCFVLAATSPPDSNIAVIVLGAAACVVFATALIRRRRR